MGREIPLGAWISLVTPFVTPKPAILVQDRWSNDPAPREEKRPDPLFQADFLTLVVVPCSNR